MIFNKLKINKIILKNKIVISPMCQYSAIKGCPSKWHYTHLQNLSSSGAGMVMMESTAVNNEGRISKSDLCLFNDKHEKKLKDLISYLKNNNDVKYGIQLSHAGRKGSSFVPWVKSNTPLPKKISWKTYSASPIPRDKKWPRPTSMSKKKILNLIKSFKKSAIRANRINLDCLEIHMAHGYLLHQFFSPISNKRNDDYGGNINNRLKLLLDIAKQVRKVWPKGKILGARITGTDHLSKGIKSEDAALLAKNLKAIGFDYVSVSSGGIIPKTKMKQYEGFRVKLANKIKKKAKIQTTTTGLITKFSTANKVVKNRKIDFITIARIIIKNPLWIYQLAKNNNVSNYIPKQYRRILK